MEINEKYESLKLYIKKLGSVAVAFSSGVDSTFLLYAAHDALGDRAIALTGVSYSFPAREKNESEEFCEKLGVKQIYIETDELSMPEYASNPKDRCYYCKKNLFSQMLETAKAQGIEYVAEGSNLDDEGDYRPGLKAIAELKVLSPLRDVGFTKAEIRAMSEKLGLPTASKPSFACLASRVPYGETITKEKLGKIEQAEQLLLEEGFSQFRVRIHGEDLARIELLPEDINRMLDEELRLRIYDKLKSFGFSYVSLDLRGYHMGSMNEKILNVEP